MLFLNILCECIIIFHTTLLLTCTNMSQSSLNQKISCQTVQV